MNIDLKLLTQQKTALIKLTKRHSGEQEIVDALDGILNLLDAMGDLQMDKFPNGIDSYLEAHHDIVEAIILDEENTDVDSKSDIVTEVRQTIGIGGIYDLAIELTTKFERENKGVSWGDEKEYYDTMEDFIKKELYHD
jgi:uncharacterized Ntn-hydrolase superfamily protein